MRNFEERWKRQNKHQINQLFTLDQDEFDLSSKQFRASDRWVFLLCTWRGVSPVQLKGYFSCAKDFLS